MKIKENTTYRVKFHDNYRYLNGQEIVIENKWYKVSSEGSFLVSCIRGNAACVNAIIRLKNYIQKTKVNNPDKAKELMLEIMDENSIYYGKIGPFGYIILESELEEIIWEIL